MYCLTGIENSTLKITRVHGTHLKPYHKAQHAPENFPKCTNKFVSQPDFSLSESCLSLTEHQPSQEQLTQPTCDDCEAPQVQEPSQRPPTKPAHDVRGTSEMQKMKPTKNCWPKFSGWHISKQLDRIQMQKSFTLREGESSSQAIDLRSFNPTPVDYWLKEMSLTIADRNLLVDGKWLTDRHVNAVSELLHNQFPIYNGLQDPLFLAAPDLPYRSACRNFIQILNIDNE